MSAVGILGSLDLLDQNSHHHVDDIGLKFTKIDYNTSRRPFKHFCMFILVSFTLIL